MVLPKGRTYTPPVQVVTGGVSHSAHSSQHGAFSASASPSTNSPVGTSSVNKIVVAQVYLLLSTIKEDKDRTQWDQKADQLRKLIGEHGMEVFQKYFSRLVVGNASTIFPGPRPNTVSANYQLLVEEMRKISIDVEQAKKIAESIETANEDIFRDFDLSTFMEHFKLDALEKTLLALAFQSGSRSDLKTKADAILAANYEPFLAILSNSTSHTHLTPIIVATIIDRYVNVRPPHFNMAAKGSMFRAIACRYEAPEEGAPPTEILAALFLVFCLNAGNQLALHMRKIGATFTSDEETCRGHLRSYGPSKLDEDQVAAALLYTTISRTCMFSPAVLVSSLRKEVGRVPRGFDWNRVVAKFDLPELRITKLQFLSLFEALLPLATEESLDIVGMWTRRWQNSEAQLSLISAYASLSPDQLDATTIPHLEPSFTLQDYSTSSPAVQERAAWAVRHPLSSRATMSAIFSVALRTSTASETVEAKRLFQEVVVPNLDIFLVSAFGVPKEWPELAKDTINNLCDRFLFKYDPNYEFVLESLWRQDKVWLAERLTETHSRMPLELPVLLEHASTHGWLPELSLRLDGFSCDLVALAHSRGLMDLDQWKENNMTRSQKLGATLLNYLNVKAQHELTFQRSNHDPAQLHSIMLPVKTISALLVILEDVLPKEVSPDLITVQRACITAYPRLINYGEGYDDIIDNNGRERNSLTKEANDQMELHYKSMYSEELQVRNVVEALGKYKHSRDPGDQDVFACMIHGLFDEYSLYGTYPLEALATTAVLFGGIISHKLISDLPLEIGLGMILEAVRDHAPDKSMYKFGLQALMQLFARLREWPGFASQLLKISGLQGTDAWNKAEEVVRDSETRLGIVTGGIRNGLSNGVTATNGTIVDMLAAEPSAPPFASLAVEEPPPGPYEPPDEKTEELIQFQLNNVTERNMEERVETVKHHLDRKHHLWLAGHIVEHRAKLQPNYQELYLGLLTLLGEKVVWTEVLRATFVSVIQMLNSESTMQNTSERNNLKNLAAWLGSLTLARDKPIKHRNIAFKQLLLEAFDTHRLMIVIPFVCRVLVEGKKSTVFKPPNPWLMDIIHLLIAMYHHAELKLNLKFEIEVLCKSLDLDHKTIEPSTEFMDRTPPQEEPNESISLDVLDRFDSLSLNGIAPGGGTGRFSPHSITASIPDLGPLLQYPPPNEMTNQGHLHEIVRAAITRAVHEIISPVVERSVTIAAISTSQMIHKDFATEPDEDRLRQAAINMVKKTAGSLALVTSKEPLRASMMNYIRALAAEQDFPLAEGTLMMCVNANLDIACNQVEKKAEERAIPEIEELINPELQLRRQHRANNPQEPYMDPALSRWAWTIPSPYKLQPNANGLNRSQMDIYDDFPSTSRPSALTGTTHIPTSSDASRTMANDILQDTYSNVPNISTPAENPVMGGPLVNAQQQPPYPQIMNGRMPVLNSQTVLDKVQQLLAELQRTCAAIPEQHYRDLPRPHPVLDILDAVVSLFIRSQQGPEAIDLAIVDTICHLLFGGNEDNLVVESLVHVLENVMRIGSRTANRVSSNIAHQSPESLMNIPLLIAMVNADLIEWQRIDSAIGDVIRSRKEGSIEFFAQLIDMVLLNEQPIALYTDFAKTLEDVFEWINDDPSVPGGQALKEQLADTPLPRNIGSSSGDDQLNARKDQMSYVFDEWVHLVNNPNASPKLISSFIGQLYNKQIINVADDLCLFLRLAIDFSVSHFEQLLHNNIPANEAYLAVDALSKLVALLVKGYAREDSVEGDRASYLDSMLSVVALVLNHHHVMRGETFNQRVFTRLFSTLTGHLSAFCAELDEEENERIILVLAETLLKLQPSYFPGFFFGWMGLVSHRAFLPRLMQLREHKGWQPFADLLESLMSYVGELLKPLHISEVTKQIYPGVLKLLVLLQHDYPDFLAANHTRLCANIPSHCIQLLNLILQASPTDPSDKLPDPMQTGLKLDRIDEMRDSPETMNDVEAYLRHKDLLDILDLALASEPSEDAVAHLTRQMQHRKKHSTGLGYVPVNVDVKLIDSIVVHVGTRAIARSVETGGATFVSSSFDARLTSMLVHELSAEARYYFISSMVNQLRFPNAHAHYFAQALLEIFGTDPNDHEESDIRQQITRVLFERLIGHWPQPWGLLATVIELVKNEKYMFFQSPFIKTAPEIADRFAALVQRQDF